MKSIPSLIAIDGPAASGKSTVGQLLAKQLGYIFLDTGVMYRAVTWLALKNKIDIKNEQDVSEIAQTIKIDIHHPRINDGRQFDVLVNGEDITWMIRDSKIDDNISQVSMYPGVRLALTRQQREIGKQGRIVMVGRDIGTVVLPDADLKIYLEASVEERAQRRYQESITRGEDQSFESILRSMKRRDQIDSRRSLAPLVPANDAIIINTDGKNIKEVLKEILQLIEKK